MWAHSEMYDTGTSNDPTWTLQMERAPVGAMKQREPPHLVSPLGDFHNFVPLRVVAKLPLREDQLPVDLHFKSVWKSIEKSSLISPQNIASLTFITLNSFNFSFWNLGQDCFRQLPCHLTVWPAMVVRLQIIPIVMKIMRITMMATSLMMIDVIWKRQTGV